MGYPTFNEVVPDWNHWVSATETRSWMECDPLLDWLDLFGTEHGFVKDTDLPSYIPEADFNEFVKRKGREFEERVVQLLDGRLQAAGLEPIVQIAETGFDSKSRDHWMETIDRMRCATPVIAQGILWDWRHGTYGRPDLLVRSDVLQNLCDASLDYPGMGAGAPMFGMASSHYVAIDIKFRGMHLATNYEADNNAAHYKVQLAIYNAALELVQGFAPPQGFFIGRSWEKGTGKNHEECSSCLDRLVPVSLPTQEQHKKDPINWLDRAIEAVQWIRTLRSDGKTWRVLPVPSNTWLHPNMKNGQDGPWHHAKAQIAEAIGEPTKIWYLGVEIRNQLIEAGSPDWRKPDFRVDLAIPGLGSTADRFVQMLSLNRSPYGPKHMPVVVDWAREEWAEPDQLEFFVDFETTSNLDDDFSKLPESGGQPLIFMIGCGHWEPIDEELRNKKAWMLDPSLRRWVFRIFYTDSLTEPEERRIIFEWYRHMDEVRAGIKGAPPRPRVFHWSPAETRTYSIGSDSAFIRHLRPSGWPDPNWYDFLANVVKQKGTSNAFFVRGAWGFGLKSLGKALHKHGFIQTLWADGPADGLAAMGGSWACYRYAEQRCIPVTDVVFTDLAGNPHILFREVIDYNEVDCRVMAESIQFIRSL